MQDLTSKPVNLVNQAKSHVLKDSAAEKKGRPWPKQLATMMRWHHGKKLVLIEGEARTSFPIERQYALSMANHVLYINPKYQGKTNDLTLFFRKTLRELAITEKGIFIIK